jgi:hypothetical protein
MASCCNSAGECSTGRVQQGRRETVIQSTTPRVVHPLGGTKVSRMSSPADGKSFPHARRDSIPSHVPNSPPRSPARPARPRPPTEHPLQNSSTDPLPPSTPPPSRPLLPPPPPARRLPAAPRPHLYIKALESVQGIRALTLLDAKDEMT